jgi:hypothetical protein
MKRKIDVRLVHNDDCQARINVKTKSVLSVE